MLSCFGTVFQPHSLSGHLPYWNIFTTILECFGSQGRKSEPTNHPPPQPDPWRFQNPNPYSYPKTREKEAFVWPINIGLHLFASICCCSHVVLCSSSPSIRFLLDRMDYGHIQVGVPTAYHALSLCSFCCNERHYMERQLDEVQVACPWHTHFLLVHLLA